MHPAFKQTDHRPWPLPSQKWLLNQQWLNLLFVHWEIDAAFLRSLIPQPLEVDKFEDKAWLAIVPFDMKAVTLRNIPPLAPLSNFPEINVRTYVKYQDKPGVWFFSLDVPKLIPVWIARSCFHLPYRYAQVEFTESDNQIAYSHEYQSEQFQANYRGLENLDAKKATFEHWATERYCLYCQNKRGRLIRTEVQHPKWPLQKAELTIKKNSLISPFPIGTQHPSVLFSKKLDVVAYPPKIIT